MSWTVGSKDVVGTERPGTATSHATDNVRTVLVITKMTDKLKLKL